MSIKNDQPQVNYHISPPILPGEKIINLSVNYYLTQLNEAGLEDENAPHMVKTLPIGGGVQPATKPQSIQISPGDRLLTSVLTPVTDTTSGRDIALITSAPKDSKITDTLHIISMNDAGELQVELVSCQQADSNYNDYVFAPETITEYIKPTSTTDKAKEIHRLIYCVARKNTYGSKVPQHHCLYDAYDPEFKVVLPMAPPVYYRGGPSMEYSKDHAFPALDHLTYFVCNNQLHLAFVTRRSGPGDPDGYHHNDYTSFHGSLYAD